MANVKTGARNYTEKTSSNFFLRTISDYTDAGFFTAKNQAEPEACNREAVGSLHARLDKDRVVAYYDAA